MADPISVIGLAISICSLLELGVKITHDTLSLVHHFQAVGHDFHSLNLRLEHDLVALRTWMSFWGVNNKAVDQDDRFVLLWGKDGREQMLKTLGALKARSDAASKLVEQYWEEMQKKPSILSRVRKKLPGQSPPAIPSLSIPGQKPPSIPLPPIPKPSEERLQSVALNSSFNGLSERAYKQQKNDMVRIQNDFRSSKKIKFVFSGKEELDTQLAELRKCLDDVRNDATMLFFAEHRNITHGQLSAERIELAVMEKSEVSAVQAACTVRKASQILYGALMDNPETFELELGLQTSSRVGKACCEAFDTTKSFQDESVKFPVLVSHTIQQQSCHRAYIAEVFTGITNSSMSYTEDHEFPSILRNCNNRCGRWNRLLSSVRGEQNKHISLLHPASLATTSRLSRVTDTTTVPVSLQTLFHELMTSDYRKSRSTFPMKKRLDLAYRLAHSVLEIESRWFQYLKPENILQRGSNGRGFDISLVCSPNLSTLQSFASLGIMDHDLQFGSTPFDKFLPQKRVQVFQLGIVLFEIGMGESVRGSSRAPEDLIEEMCAEMLPVYATVVETCLRCEICQEVDDFKFLEDFIKNVVEPLKFLTEPGAIMKQRRAKREA